MSCVIGIVEKGITYFGYETTGAGATQKARYNTPKVFRSGDYVIGYAGSYRVGQILRYYTKYPNPDYSDLSKLMSTEFVDAMMSSMDDNRVIKNRDEIAEMDGAETLVSIGGKLFVVQTDLSVVEPKYNYWAIGSGWSVALGSLYSTDEEKIGVYISPQDRINIAISAASEYIITVGSEVVIFER